MRTMFAVVMLLCFAPLTDAAPPRYRVTDVGPAYDRFGERVSVNARGQVAGTVPVSDVGHHVSGNLPCRAFLWQRGRRTVIAPTPGYSATYVGAINNKGQIAGTLNETSDGATLVIDNHAFLWERGKMRDVGEEAGWAVTSAEAINSQGDIVGNAARSARPFEDDGETSTQSHAFLYSRGSLTDLGLGAAYGINDKRQVVGTLGFEATLWQNNEPRDLGIRGLAVAINGRGQVIISTGLPNPISYLWESGASHALTTLHLGSHSMAKDINNRGQIVGGSQTEKEKHPRALLWQSSRVYDLNSLIPSRSGWTLEEATGINDKGQIVGYGILHGSDHAFLLTPAGHPTAPAE